MTDTHDGRRRVIVAFTRGDSGPRGGGEPLRFDGLGGRALPGAPEADEASAAAAQAAARSPRRPGRPGRVPMAARGPTDSADERQAPA